MARSAAGPAVLSTSTRPPGAVSRAQQPAPRGAMQSGAAAGRRDDGDDDEDEVGFSNLSGGLDSPNDGSRGRAVAPRRQWRSTAGSDDDADGVGPLPSGKNDREDSGSRDRRSRSRDSSSGSIAKRLGAGLSGVLRGRSASRERESRSLSRQNTDASTILGECFCVQFRLWYWILLLWVTDRSSRGGEPRPAQHSVSRALQPLRMLFIPLSHDEIDGCGLWEISGPAPPPRTRARRKGEAGVIECGQNLGQGSQERWSSDEHNDALGLSHLRLGPECIEF